MIGAGDLRPGETLDAWAERIAHELEAPHWKGLRWLAQNPQPFAFPNGSVAHGILVSYQCTEVPTADKPYWRLSKRGKAIFAYVERVAMALSKPMLRAISADDHKVSRRNRALLGLGLVAGDQHETCHNTPFAVAVMKWVRDHHKDLLP